MRPSRKIWAVLTILLLVSGATIGGLFTTSGGTTNVDSRFHLSVRGTTSYNRVELESVDCPSATTCVAVGRFRPSGGSLSTASESRSLFLVLNALEVESVYIGPLGSYNQTSSVSCATSSSCVAVGTEGNQGVTWSLADGRWTTRPVAGANELQSVSCTSRTFCMAAGSVDDGKATFWRYDGRRWTAMSPGVAGPESATIDLLQCVSPTFCAAGGSEGPSANCVLCKNPPPPIPWVSTFDGSVWRTVTLKVPHYGGILDALSCVSASHCIAVGTMWPKSSVLLTSTSIDDTWNGARWSDNRTGELNGLQDVQEIDAVACSRGGCVLTGEYGGLRARHRFQLNLMHGRHLLSTRKVGPGELDSLSAISGCTRDGWCLLMVPGDVPNSNGPPVYFTSQHVDADRQLAIPRSIVNVYDLVSLSCGSSRWCIVVGGIPWSTSVHPTIPVLVWNGTSIVSAYLQSLETKH